MEEPIVSEFSTYCYIKAIAVIVVFIGGVLISIFTLNGEEQTIGNLLTSLIVSCILFGICYYYIATNLIKVTVSQENILLDYYLTKKQVVVDYNNIKSLYTYRPRRIETYQNLLIEFGDNKSISIGYGDYNNYDAIKAAIYKYKSGIGV